MMHRILRKNPVSSHLERTSLFKKSCETKPVVSREHDIPRVANYSAGFVHLKIARTKCTIETNQSTKAKFPEKLAKL